MLGPALEAAGHELVDLRAGRSAMVDFTRPDAVETNVRARARAGVPCVVGTTGMGRRSEVDGRGARSGLPLLFAPNFAIGAVLMMRFAEEAAALPRRAPRSSSSTATRSSTRPRALPRRRPSGWAATPIHSVRLPGLVAHQEVLLGGAGELLTIRHDATSREAYVPGVLLALERLRDLPPGLTVGLERS